jgi:subtilisin family serine protease
MSPLSSLFRASSNCKKRRGMRSRSPSRTGILRVRLSVEPLEDRTLLTARWLGNLAGPDGLRALIAPVIERDGTAAVVWDGGVHHAVAGQWVAGFTGVAGTADQQVRNIQHELDSHLPAELGATVVRQLGLDGQVLIHVSTSVPENRVSAIADLENVAYVEPNCSEGSVAVIPNDPDFSKEYGLQNTGQVDNGPFLPGQVGIPGADVSATRAWDLTTGSYQIVVADIDTGMDYTHPDLRNNVWLNNAEIPASRLQNLKRYVSNPSNPDDTTKPVTFADLNDSRNWGAFKITPHNSGGNMVVDANDVLANMDRDGSGNDLGTGGWAFPGNTQDGDTAHPNDYVGWNFVNNTNRPLDDNSHGTHTAGTIGAEGNNGVGVVGVNWVTQMMPLKWIAGSGSGNDADAIAAVNYSVLHEARVSSNSWHIFDFNVGLYDAVKNAQDHGDLFVAAAQNSSINNDTGGDFPAIFTRATSAGPALDNVISVAATDNRDGLASFSNYGLHTVQLGAPGVDVWSTFPGSYGYDSGTSMATPHVAGAATLLWGYSLNSTYLDIKNAIMNGVDPIPSLNGRTVTGGRLDVYNSLLLVAPAAGPTVLSNAPTGNIFGPVNSIRFTFDTAINPDTFTTDQVRTFTGPGGVDLLHTVAGATLVPGSNGKQFDVTLTTPVASLGNYSMQIGPNILDTTDRPMDQNRNGVAGEDPEDRYTAIFTIQGPKITASTDQNDVALVQDYLPGKLAAVRLTFNEPMDPATFNPSQVLFSSPTRPAFVASSFTPIPNTNNRRFSVQFPADANLTAAYTLTVLPLMKDLFGNQLDQNGNFIPGEIPGDNYVLHFNTLGPKVTASQTLTFGDPANQVYNTLRVTFNEAMDPASFTQAQVKLTAPGGGMVQFTNIVPAAGNTQFDIVYAPQGKIGMYTVVLGPNIKDTFGNSMDQNGNLIPGETPGDQYSTTFTVQGPKVIATSPTTSLAPVGSLRVTFSKPIDASTFTPDKIASFSGPAGPIGVDGVFAVPGSNLTQFDVDFRPQTTTGSTQTLSLDDGSGEEHFNNSLGVETEDNWVANSFQVAPGGQILTSISFLLGENYSNRAITALIYTGSSLTDPHAGSGLTRISTTDTTVSGVSGSFVTIPFNTAVTLPVGQVYWAAVLLRNVPGGQFPFWNDTNAPKGRSWFDVGPTQSGAYNVDDTTRATVFGGSHPVLGGVAQQAGNLMLRVNTVGTAYRMVLGPDIHDLFGNKMDQNGNLIDGEIPGDQYLATFNIQGLRITTASPMGQQIALPVDHVRLTFNESVNPASFTLSQVDSLSGPHGAITVTGVSAVPLSNNFQFDVAFAPQSAAGTYTLVVGPHIRDIYGNEMDQNGNGIPGEDPGDRFTTTFSLAGPTVISASPSGPVLPPVDHVRLTFNEPMVPATFTPARVTFTGPGGAIEITAVTPVADSNNTQFDVGFETQTALGAYTMVIAAGIMDPFGESAPQFTDHFALSPLNNGGFETGDFTGWTTIGITAIKTSSFGQGPTEGTFDALITNGSLPGGGPDHTVVEPFLGLAPNALATLVSNVTNGSAIKQTISVSAGSTLTFDWNFLTNEAAGEMTYRDFAFVSITPVGAGGTLQKLADTVSPLVVAPAATGFPRMTGFRAFSFTFTTSGTYTLGVGAMNAGDTNFDSAVLVDNFQITPLGGSIDHSGGFADHGDLTANGSMIFAGTAAQLTSGAPGVFNQAGSFFTTSRVDITSFVTSFTFQLTAGTNPVGNGITFTIQGTSPTALGPLGGGLGYGPDQPNTGQRGIRNSVAVKFKTIVNVVGQETGNDTGLFTDGRSPTVPEAGSGDVLMPLDAAVIDLHSQDPFQVLMTYDGATLHVTITDTVTNMSAEQFYTVNIPGKVGGNVAYLGFTGGTGSHTGFQVINTWTFGPPSPAPGPLGGSASGPNDNGQRPEDNGEAMPTSLLVPPATLRFPASASATDRLFGALGTSSSANGGLDSASNGTTSDDFPFELSGRAGRKDHAADLFDTLAGPPDEGNSWL